MCSCPPIETYADAMARPDSRTYGPTSGRLSASRALSAGADARCAASCALRARTPSQQRARHRARARRSPIACDRRPATIGTISRVVLVRNASSAPNRSSSRSTASRTGMPTLGADLEQELARDARQQAGVERRRQRRAVLHDEQVRRSCTRRARRGSCASRLRTRRAGTLPASPARCSAGCST